MKTVLLLNNTKILCGVQQWGIRLGNILPGSKKYKVAYKEISSLDEYKAITKELRPDIIVYNYHVDTMPWLHFGNLVEYSNRQKITLQKRNSAHLK